jgi:hypothetical protein
MDTLKLGEQWICKLFLFSGQPDPEWMADEKTLVSAIVYCNNAISYEGSFEIPSVLGYRGVGVFNAEQSITVFGGVIEIKEMDQITLKTDKHRQLEMMLVKSAPEPYKSIVLEHFFH